MKILKRFAVVFVLVAQLIPMPALAISIDNVVSVDYPQPSEIIGDIEDRYHLDPGALRRFGEAMNVSEQKATAPQVSLFFSPNNPVPGQELTANAAALYFSNGEDRLYYTWYLKHQECGTDNSVGVNDDNKFCDTDNDGDVDEKDWKIEAMRIIANGGFDTSRSDYSGDSDQDGYEASFGGDGNTRIPERCYIQDFSSGTLYEFASGSSTVDYGCGANMVARCVDDDTLLCTEPPEFPWEDPVETEYSICEDTGSYPTCFDSNVTCLTGTARCVPLEFTTPTCDDDTIEDTACSSIGTSISSCSQDVSDVSNGCNHLFPNSPTDTTGDGSFTASEERFWGTDPSDPNTAGVGRGDEANVVGLGQRSFTWNYAVGDEVGVVVEGTSVIPTKKDDRSYAVMWALPKNDCPIENVSSYQQTIRGYDVTFYTTTTNINDCLERNLVDPREGGQVNKIQVSLSSSPESVANDASGDNAGSTLFVSSVVSNATVPDSALHYDWTVRVSNDGTYNPRNYSMDPEKQNDGWKDITSLLKNNGLISLTQGTGLSEFPIRLNMTDEMLGQVGLDTNTVFPGGEGYLKIAATVSQYADSTGSKVLQDTGTIIVHVISSDQHIIATSVNVENAKLATGDTICDESLNLDETKPVCSETSGPDCYNPLGIGRNVCLVAKNEIIGLKVGELGQYQDYRWMVNNQPLSCTGSMSSGCSDQNQTNVNFLPVTGEPGEGYTVTVSALNVSTGKRIAISRVFQVIDPYIQIVSENPENAWPKYLGYYKGTDGYAYERLSENQFETFPGVSSTFQIKFFPAWVQNRSHWYWNVGGRAYGEENQTEATIDALAGIGAVYTMSVVGYLEEDVSIRNALNTFWGHVPAESVRTNLSVDAQLQIVQGEESEYNAFTSPSAFFAAVAKNASAQVLFFARLALSVFFLVVLMSVLFTLSGNRGWRQQ